MSSSRAGFGKLRAMAQGRKAALGQPATNDWLAVIDQHHRMVQTLAVVTPVSSRDRRREPGRH